MPDPAIAAVVGRAPAGTPGPEIFYEMATKHAMKCLPKRDLGQDFDLKARDLFRSLDHAPSLGAKQAAILLCVERSASQTEEIIQGITARRAHAEVIVYADQANDSGILAMKCAKPESGRGARGFLIRDRSPEAHVRDLFHRLFNRNRMYPPLRQVTRAASTSSPKAFIVTPYHTEALTHYYDGIEPALRALDVEPIMAWDEVTSGAILQNVQTLINECAFVVVNLSEYEGFGPNANCYFELGYALGRGLPVILVRRAGAGPVATDLSGVQLVEYSDLAELSMRLYHGLQPEVS